MEQNHLQAREKCREGEWWNNGNKTPEDMSFSLHRRHGPPVSSNVVHVLSTHTPPLHIFFYFLYLFFILILSLFSSFHFIRFSSSTLLRSIPDMGHDGAFGETIVTSCRSEMRSGLGRVSCRIPQRCYIKRERV